MRQRRYWLLLAVVVFLGGFAYSYARLDDRQSVNGKSELIRLSERALVTKQYMLSDGRRAGLEHTEPGLVGLVGASYDELYQANPSWNILRFGANELVVEVACEVHVGGYIGERDGFVAVFDGIPGPCSVLRELTTIPSNKVPPNDRVLLKQGALTFHDDNGMQELLDGLVGDG